MGQAPCAGSGEAQHLQSVGQKIGMALGLAIFHIIVDGMVVAGYGLKSRKIGFRNRSRRYGEFIVDVEIFKKFRFSEF